MIGDASISGRADGRTVIGNVEIFTGDIEDILYVVYTEREAILLDDHRIDVIRLISARLANDFERGFYSYLNDPWNPQFTTQRVATIRWIVSCDRPELSGDRGFDLRFTSVCAEKTSTGRLAPHRFHRPEIQ